MKGGETVWMMCHIMNTLQKAIRFGNTYITIYKIGIKEKYLFTPRVLKRVNV